MIAELTKDLIAKLNTVTEFQGRVGTQTGGTDTDNQMSEAPIPFAWVIFSGSTPREPEQSGAKKYLQADNHFIAIIAFSYGDSSDDDFAEDQLSLIDKCIVAVHSSTELSNAGLWQYNGCDLHTVYPNRLVYQLSFTAVGHQRIS
jgi:hypothetical protein